MTSAPAVGHVVPLLALGQALRAAGHCVRVATHPDVHRYITGAGLDPVAAGISHAAMAQERLRRWPETINRPTGEWAVRMFAQILAPTTLTDLVQLCDDWQPELVIHEEGEYAGPVAAAHAGVPWVCHAWGSPLRPVEDLDQIEQQAIPLSESVGLPTPRWGGLYEYGLLNPCPAALQPNLPGAGASSWPIRPTQLTGSSVPSLIGGGPPDVYIGFGTVPRFAEDETALADAVRACVARRLRTVVTTPNPDQARRLGSIHPQLVSAGTFVAISEVLASCRLVVCHAGAGTVLAALAVGVPLVAVDKGTPSQTRMASACAAAGVAVVPAPEPGGIAAAISLVLDDPRFLERAQELSEDIRGMPAPAALVPVLEQVAART